MHLLLKSRNIGMSGTMRKRLARYAIYFNTRHGRTGHLFQNRGYYQGDRKGRKEAETGSNQ